MVRISTTLALSAIACATGVNGIPTISAKGSKFFTSDGNQFFVKGKYHPPPNAIQRELQQVVANRIDQASHTNSSPTTRSSARRNAPSTPRS